MLIDYESTYQAELAKMSAEFREAKRTARLEGAALEEDWRSQFASDRVAQFTVAASKTGLSVGFLEPSKAMTLAVQHSFENRSVVEEAEMITEILKWGIGTVPVGVAEAFVQSGRFLRNPLNLKTGMEESKRRKRLSIRLIPSLRDGPSG
jgi:hypothetical protein